MKSVLNLKTYLLTILFTVLPLFVLARGGTGPGGGNVSSDARATEETFFMFLGQLKPALKGALNSYQQELAYVADFGDYKAVLFPDNISTGLMKKINEMQIFPQYEPCLAPEGPRDASVLSYEKNQICLSVGRLLENAVIPSVLPRKMIGAAAHEVTHLMGGDEEMATYVGDLLGDISQEYPLWEYSREVDGLASSYEMAINEIQKITSTQSRDLSCHGLDKLNSLLMEIKNRDYKALKIRDVEAETMLEKTISQGYLTLGYCMSQPDNNWVRLRTKKQFKTGEILNLITKKHSRYLKKWNALVDVVDFANRNELEKVLFSMASDLQNLKTTHINMLCDGHCDSLYKRPKSSVRLGIRKLRVINSAAESLFSYGRSFYRHIEQESKVKAPYCAAILNRVFYMKGYRINFTSAAPKDVLVALDLANSDGEIQIAEKIDLFGDNSCIYEFVNGDVLFRSQKDIDHYLFEDDGKSAIHLDFNSASNSTLINLVKFEGDSPYFENTQGGSLGLLGVESQVQVRIGARKQAPKKSVDTLGLVKSINDLMKSKPSRPKKLDSDMTKVFERIYGIDLTGQKEDLE